jgi:hypothetical protein
MTKNKEKFLNKALFYLIERQNEEGAGQYIDYVASFSNSNTNILAIVTKTRKYLENDN